MSSRGPVPRCREAAAILLPDHISPVWEMGARRPFLVKGAPMPSTYDQERKLEREVADAIRERLPEVDVLALELVSPARFCVYIDSPDGVDHALCGRVTDALRGFLDRYAIDVSSPGIERPVRKPEHFRQVVGRRVALRPSPPIDGRKRFRGTVVAADERAVKVETETAEPVDIPYESIVRGNLIDEGSLT